MRIFLEKKLNFIKQLYLSTDLLFLVFLLLFLNVKLPVKIAGLVLIYAFRFNFKFGISFKKNSRLPVFYLLMIGLSFIELLINFNFTSNYLLLFGACVAFWSICFLVIHQVKLAIEIGGVEKVKNSVEVFLIINMLVSLFNLLLIMLETRSINPYTFEGLSYKYFVSTGDNIRGVTGDVCTTNMIINVFGLFYFFTRHRYWLSFISLWVMLITTSNLGNVILLIFLTVLFITDKNKFHKSILLIYLGCIIVFMVKISPSNLNYFQGSYAKLSEPEPPVVQAPITPQPQVEQPVEPQKRKLNSDSIILAYISSRQAALNKKTELEAYSKTEIAFTKIQAKMKEAKEPVQTTDASFEKHEQSVHSKIMDYCKSVYGDSLKSEDVFVLYNHKKVPGKLQSFFETAHYMKQNVKSFLFGAGPGNFSSKFAFRALGLNLDGSWPARYTYHSEAFKENHMKLWIFYRIQPPGEHSVINHPNSCANQLLGEYGLVGTLLFFIFYIWYFIKRYKFMSFGKFIFPLMLVFLGTDYWFENLSVMIIFETLIFLDIHKKEVID